MAAPLKHPSPSRAVSLAVAAVAAAALLITGVLSAPTAAANGEREFVFDGNGWGHGVGMSQWGARGMAADGSSAQSILTHYYRGVTVGAGTVNDDLRVLLTEKAASVTLTAHGPTTIDGVGTFGSGQSVTLARSGGSVAVSGALSASISGDVVVRYPSSAEGAIAVSSTGNRYRYGTLAVRADPAGGIRAIVTGLSMQQYLYGLAEMYTTWPAEALKAQAIAGRTFAQKRRAERSTADFDLYASVTHQSYMGTKFEVPAWTAAVDATDRMVITHGGALIDAVYSASSGGHTENSEAVWGGTVAYLKGVADPYDATGGNPDASWSRRYSGTELGAWFGVGTATSVELAAPAGVSGRLDRTTVRVTGTTGSVSVTGASFRTTVNARVASGRQLRSTMFRLVGSTPAPPPTPPAPPPPTPPPVALPTGTVTTARAEGRSIIIAGRVHDPDGAPIIRVVSTMGSERAVREVASRNGEFLAVWSGSRGTRNVCVTAVDVPTGQQVSLGCHDVVVK